MRRHLRVLSRHALLAASQGPPSARLALAFDILGCERAARAFVTVLLVRLPGIAGLDLAIDLREDPPEFGVVPVPKIRRLENAFRAIEIAIAS